MGGIMDYMPDAHPASISLGLAVVSATALYYCKRRRRVRSVLKDTAVLHDTFGRGPHAPSFSTFVLKLETYFRMASVPYENNFGASWSSKGKTPWMTYNGIDVADSQFCIEYLNKKLGLDLNKHLSAEEKAVALAFRRMAEDNLHWGLVHLLFLSDPAGKEYKLKKAGMSRFAFWIVSWIIQRSLWQQGMGRHSREEVESIVEKDLRAISAFLGDKPYILGLDPCQEDCAVFAALAQFKWHFPGSKAHHLIYGELSNLSEYCERMKARYWPDWDAQITCPE